MDNTDDVVLYGGSESDKNDDDDDTNGGGHRTSGHTNRDKDNIDQDESSSKATSDNTALKWWMEKYCWKDDVSKSKKKIEAPPGEDINLLELCEMKDIFSEPLDVPNIDSGNIFGRSKRNLDYDMILELENQEFDMKETTRAWNFLGQSHHTKSCWIASLYPLHIPKATQ